MQLNWDKNSTAIKCRSRALTVAGLSCTCRHTNCLDVGEPRDKDSFFLTETWLKGCWPHKTSIKVQF